MKKKFQNSKTETIVYFICSLAGLLLVWQLAVSFTSLQKVMPSPFVVLGFIGESLTQKIGGKILPLHILASLKRVFVGYFLAFRTGQKVTAWYLLWKRRQRRSEMRFSLR